MLNCVSFSPQSEELGWTHLRYVGQEDSTLNQCLLNWTHANSPGNIVRSVGRKEGRV